MNIRENLYNPQCLKLLLSVPLLKLLVSFCPKLKTLVPLLLVFPATKGTVTYKEFFQE